MLFEIFCLVYIYIYITSFAELICIILVCWIQCVNDNNTAYKVYAVITAS